MYTKRTLSIENLESRKVFSVNGFAFELGSLPCERYFDGSDVGFGFAQRDAQIDSRAADRLMEINGTDGNPISVVTLIDSQPMSPTNDHHVAALEDAVCRGALVLAATNVSAADVLDGFAAISTSFSEVSGLNANPPADVYRDRILAMEAGEIGRRDICDTSVRLEDLAGAEDMTVFDSGSDRSSFQNCANFQTEIG